MLRKLALFLCASLAFASISALASTQNGTAMSLSMTPGLGIALDVSRTSPEFTSISISNPDIQVVDVEEGFETYQMFTLEGEPVLPAEGCPAVPQVSRFYRIPNTGGVDLIVNTAEYDLQEGVNAYPYFSEEVGFSLDSRSPVVYGKNEWYPAEVAVMSAPMVFRDFRVVQVTLHPVQVNPSTGQARVYSNISVDIVANGRPGDNELLNPRRPSGLYSRLYRDFISNLDESALDDATTTPGSYLIVADDATTMTGYVEDLAEWKMRKGYSVAVARDASWTSNEIQDYVRDFADEADPPLEFVCLMGDPQATFGVPTMTSQYDHGYALANSSDNLEDWAVGRLSGNSTSEMNTIMAKLLNYESDPYMDETDWFTTAYFQADVGHEIASNYTLMQWAAQQFALNTGIVNYEVDHTNSGANYGWVEDQLEDGVCIFFWRGSWLGEMGTDLAGMCDTGWRLPVVLTVTCGAGNFDFGLGTQESYLVAGTATSPKGGIAAIGTATSGTHAPQNITFSGGLAYAMSVQEIEHLGTALSAGKVWLARTWGAGSDGDNNFSAWNNLMGDPGLVYWTDIPIILDVSHPTTLNVGARELNVSVSDDATGDPIQDALVVLWKGPVSDIIDGTSPETYVKALTDANGEATLPVTVNSAGDVRLTVSKRNHKPYLFDIPCVVVDQMLTVENVTLDDDMAGGTSGNSNGQYNPGETVDLSVALRNYGSTVTGTGISATLDCDHPDVTVLNNSSTFPNIAPGAQASGASAFRVQLAPTMKHGATALLRFTVNSSSAVAYSTVELRCKAGAVEYVTHQFLNGTFTPGTDRSLRITIRNSGELAMDDVTASLLSMSPFIAVNTPTVSFGDIGDGQQVDNNADPFELSSLDLTYPGHQAVMRLFIETSTGYRDTTQFTLNVGTASAADPTGPDAYGYYAYDSDDDGYEFTPTFDYVNISAGLGTDVNLNDTGEKTTVSQMYSTVRDLPFEFIYYGVSYDQVTLCANGWLAFGDQDFNDNFRNFPIPAMAAPNAMLAPFWDDLRTSNANQGVWDYYDEANDRYVVQWKAGVGSGYSSPVDFEIILYDPTVYPTFDGNGEILFQYNDMPANATNLAADAWGETPGASVGFHDQTAMVGLGLAYKNEFASGINSAVFTDGRAIKITTESRALFGQIEGHVTDAETGLPLEGVSMTLDGFNYFVASAADGYYHIENVLVGNYTVRAARHGYNDITAANIVVELDQTETIDFALLHPEFVLSTDHIEVSLPEDEPVTSFQIINDGNGPLDYSIEIVYTGGGEPVDPWGQLEDISVSSATGDAQILGCEFVNDYWYVSGGDGLAGGNKLYKFDLNGDYVGWIQQPSVSAFGWYDLAYDGQYLYGSEDGSGTIQGMDLVTGEAVVTIPSPLNPTRAIAYDPVNDHFWIADYTQDLYQIDRFGQMFNQITNQGANELSITGLAWNPSDPDGYKLYIFSQNGGGTLTQVSRMHPFSFDIQPMVELPANEGDVAGGCAITGGWNSALLVFGGILMNSGGDRLSIHQVDFNTVWIDVEPMASSVAGGTQRDVSISFDTEILRNATYQVSLLIYNPVLDVEFELPVTLDVLEAVDPMAPEVIPAEYALHQNYPNPFNPSTTIRYDLKNSGLTNLTVYNVMGQQIVELVNETQQAGSYSVHFEANSLTSGVYFYRLTSGDFVQTSKMVLMK